MNFPVADMTIDVKVGQYRPALFIRCTREYFDSKIDLQLLENNFLTVSSRQNNDGELCITHLNPQTPEYWNQLADWFTDALNN